MKARTREGFIELVKASGQEVINRAEDLVGSHDMMTDFDIHLSFPTDSLPIIEVTRSHVSKECYNVLLDQLEQ